MPELLTICRACGREWTPDHIDYVRATWRTCRRCRDTTPDTTQEEPSPELAQSCHFALKPGDAMSDYPVATNAPFDLSECRWLLANGSIVPIVGLSRRRVIVDRYGHRHELKRRDLSRDGVTYDGAVEFRVSRYQLPSDREAE